MLKDIIHEVREAEEKAEEIKRRAHVESRRMLQDAENKAAQVYQQYVRQAEEEVKAILAKAREEGEKQAQEIADQAKKSVNEIREAGLQRQEQAILMVIERIVKADGHCENE